MEVIVPAAYGIAELEIYFFGVSYLEARRIEREPAFRDKIIGNTPRIATKNKVRLSGSGTETGLGPALLTKMLSRKKAPVLGFPINLAE